MTRDPSSLRSVREETIDDLCGRFAADELSLGELERRLEKARAARTRAELNDLLADLRPARASVAEVASRPRDRPARRAYSVPEAATDARPSTGVDAQAARASSHLAFAVMGGTRRAGRWVPPSNLAAVALMGGVELDFREAVLSGRDVEINCFAFMGGIEITVPPDVHVETHGFALMGGFEQNAELETNPGPDAPTVRINGFALMGGVEVKVAPRGQPIRGSGAAARGVGP